MLVSSQIRCARPNDQQGYVLLTLLLIIALMTIFAATLVTDIKFQIKRDREEEMIHRGVQYSRAIRAYYRKFNRYPAKIEDLENTNQQRFLRKRYKDPLTGKDFRLLHYGEAKMALAGMGGGVVPGASTLGANGQLVQQGGFQSASPQGGFQTSSFGGNSYGASSSFGQNSAFGNSNSAFGQNNQNTQNTQTPSDSSPQAPANGQDSQDAAGGSSTGPGNGSGTGSTGSSALSGQFGGAPIVGVASTSKDKTIREFDKKKKYNEWQFIYDPTMDRGGLITTPYQPQLMTQGIQGMQNVNGQNGAVPNGTGFPNSFGNNNNNNGFGNSFGNSPAGMQNTPTSPPSQPSNPPQQQ